MKTLYPYQIEGVKFLQSKRKILLADEMGLGKTIQVVSAIPKNTPTIIVCPAVVKNVWMREFEEMRPEFKVTILSGRKSFRWPTINEVIITNYDILPDMPKSKEEKKKAFSKPLKFPNEFCDNVAVLPFTYMVCDEAHVLKNKKTKAWQIVKKLAYDVLVAKGKTWPLTATPILNRPPELWALLDAFYMAGTVFEGGYQDFCDSFNAVKQLKCWCHNTIEVTKEGAITHLEPICKSFFQKVLDTDLDTDLDSAKGAEYTYKLRSRGHRFGLPVASVSERLKRIMLRRERKDVLLDLPPKTYNDITVDISSAALAEYNRIYSKLPEPILWPNSIEAFYKLLEASGKNVISQLTECRQIIAESKIDHVVEFIDPFEEEKTPIVVFSAHRAPIDFLSKRKGWKSITGDTPIPERNRIVDTFQAGQVVGLCATIQAGGVGITLTRACHSLFIDLTWTPALNEQAEDRLYRIGQKNAVCIHRLLVDHPIEKHLHKILTNKKTLISETLNSSKA